MFLFFSSAIYMFFLLLWTEKTTFNRETECRFECNNMVADKIPSIYEKCAKSTVSKDR